MTQNLDEAVVAGFGDEWSRFDQTALSSEELAETFDAYFCSFPWDSLPANSVGFDAGCGSGRWATLVAPKVGTLHLIEPSPAAMAVARNTLKGQSNCIFHQVSVDEMPLADGSCDFGYSLGVLHHIPDTYEGIRSCVEKLRPGSPFLVYLYYRFDNRPMWFRALHQASSVARFAISRLPNSARYLVSQVIAATVYFPLARIAMLLERAGFELESFPLWYYRNRSFYFMRTDALDRFGTKLERRFTKAEIHDMMTRAGLTNISFNPKQYWTAIGYKKGA